MTKTHANIRKFVYRFVSRSSILRRLYYALNLRINRVIVNQSIIDKFHAPSYLEIGLAGAYNFYCIDVHHKIAVDPKVKNNWCINKLKTYKNTKLVELTSDEFFASNIEYFDLIFIDGLHQSQQVIKDVQNALKFLNPNGIIVLHDCNPTSKVIFHKTLK